MDGSTSGEGSVRVVALDAPDAKRAELRWKTLDRHRGRSLVEVELLTGRKHQIRAQLAARGAPVLGDFRYGNEVQFAGGHGIALHAHRLALEHPTKKEPLTISAPPPDAWRGLFERAVLEAVNA